MGTKEKGRYVGLVGALLVHVALVFLLLLVGFVKPEQEEEGGVPVVLGDMSVATGWTDATLTQVDIEAEAENAAEAEQEMITQEEEETVAIKPHADKKKETVRPEKSAEEKAKEEQRLAAEKAEREAKAAEEAARKRVAGAFGKGAKMGSQEVASTTGVQGSAAGNAPQGASEGVGGYGTFDLGGRSLGEGGLPRPVYNVQDEGKVVVSIIVNPSGRVIATSINKQTNTVNTALRKAAEEAARKARFNAVSGLDNQTGTITYYFNLK